MANINDATNAYTSALNALKKAGADGAIDETVKATGTSPFGDLLKQSLTNAVDAQHKSEKVSAQALAGKADMTDVLQAVTNAEMALNTVLAVRDKVVQAYEQVMRTSI
jgi:flagellar hook-basal body complex protein FliE